MRTLDAEGRARKIQPYPWRNSAPLPPAYAGRWKEPIAGGATSFIGVGRAGEVLHGTNECPDLAAAGERFGRIAPVLEGVSVTLRRAP